MSDQNAVEPQPTDEAVASVHAAPEAANPDPNETSGPAQEQPAAEAAAAQPAASPSIDQAERELMFETLERAMRSADFDFPKKTGQEFDVGRRSVDLAEHAFIGAALLDRNEAIDVYRRHSLKEPSDVLLRRVDHAQRSGNRIDIGDLTAGIASLDKKRFSASSETSLRMLQQTKADKQIAVGDEVARANDYRKRATGEVITPEQNKDDSGLFLVKAVMSGMRAADDYRNWGRSRRKAGIYKGNVKETEGQIGQIVKEAKAFDVSVQAPTRKATTGPAGKSAKKFSGLGGVATQVAGKSMGAAKAVAVEAVSAIEAGSNQSQTTQQMRRADSQRSTGISL